MPALAERETDVAGARVRHRVAGSGPPLVLVHGLAGSSRWWSRVLPALAERRTVHLVDLPGFGGLGRRARRLPLAHTGAWLLAWLDAAGLERPALGGHSMGGAIAVRTAAAAPERLDRLLLVAPAGLFLRPLVGYGLPFVRTLRRTGPRLAWLVGADAARAGPLTLARATREVVAEDVRAELRAVRVPTLVVCGERDTLVPPAVGDVVRRELPAAELAVLPGAGHVPMHETPELLARTLLAFLGDG